MKTNAYQCLTKRFAIEKLEVNSHLYTSGQAVDGFPCRSFRILRSFGMGKKNVNEGIKGIEKANITVRNFSMEVNTLRQRPHLKEGGDTYLFAMTHAGRPNLLLCEKL